MLEAASGVKAFSVGKPSPVMLRAARKELGLTTDQTVVIGDTMETDILGGVQLGYKTILVLSGGTRREDLARYAYRPDMIVDSIADLDPAELESEFSKEVTPPVDDRHPAHHYRASRRWPGRSEQSLGTGKKRAAAQVSRRSLSGCRRGSSLSEHSIRSTGRPSLRTRSSISFSPIPC